MKKLVLAGGLLFAACLVAEGKEFRPLMSLLHAGGPVGADKLSLKEKQDLVAEVRKRALPGRAY